VDAERVATMGWSNGSILSTSLLVTYPSRYKVASVGAGDVEWLSDWGNVDFGQSFDAYYFGKSPFEDPQLYINKSPFFKMDKVQAPVLIFHGTADRNVPPAQSWSYFRALQHFDKTVKYVVFPGEPHGPRKLTHQLRKVEEEAAWFDKYFFKTAKPENEAFKKDSPLASELRRRKLWRVGSAYGMPLVEITTTTAGKLSGAAARKPKESPVVPQVAKRQDLLVGVFEVTRAQYAEFDKKSKPEPGKENYPASAITLENAQAYVEWLNRQSSDKWRIPFDDELKTLYENRDAENTLDFWAGYAPNPEDTAKLREKAKELGGNTSLLKEVGSFAGKGQDDEEPIYDLGGNVAEWVLNRDGKGKVVGGSADCPADPKANCTPAPEYIGFRVVRGPAKPAPPSD
jgi:hypothetical protein